MLAVHRGYVLFAYLLAYRRMPGLLPAAAILHWQTGVSQVRRHFLPSVRVQGEGRGAHWDSPIVVFPATLAGSSGWVEEDSR